jgi:intracellular multiplication protein IcmB
MTSILKPITDSFNGLLAWLGAALGQSAEYYCVLESANSTHTLVARDGSLVSIIECHGVTHLVGEEEFERIHSGLTQSLQTSMSRNGYGLQLYFCHDKDPIKKDLNDTLASARLTAKNLQLDLDDFFEEKVNYLAQYCAFEKMYLVLWTHPHCLDEVRQKQAIKDKGERIKTNKIPSFINSQNIFAALPEIKDAHQAYVKSLLEDMQGLGFQAQMLDIHEACSAIRNSVDKEFTDLDWRACLPGDKMPMRLTKFGNGGLSDLLWPPLYKQLIPRDGENLDLRTARIGDQIYGSVFVDLLPQNIQPFVQFFKRILPMHIPWRLSFSLQSNGIGALGLKPMIASILTFASNDNKLISGAAEILNHLNSNTDEAIVILKITATTWGHYLDEKGVRGRISELAKALQGWGSMETSEVSGDAYQGVMSSALGISMHSVARATVAPLSEVTYMFPLNRPASPWKEGAILFRSTDGKPWPYQPGSSLQTTWIDMIYARPGSGKSVLSNSINLALCLSAGLQRLPRIAIIDIGPSSSGLISLLRESLPENQKHLVAYHRLQMDEKTAINPFDTQLGCRIPTPQDRAFLVNFLTLLATPVGDTKPYDGITDMAGLIVDELYKSLTDEAKPIPYTANIDFEVDKKLTEHNIVADSHTTWWEIVDLLFDKNETHIAMLAQRYAMPLLADAASICRSQAVEDLYGNIKAPTGETVIGAFARMISSAVREYPILSKVTTFDLGDARVVSLDLDEVAKTGGEMADRQTAVMYMLSRYILARHYYLVEDLVSIMPKRYQEYHLKRIKEIREDPKRIVYDEFHRTSNAKAVRDQVIVDMREGRKWKVHVALLSQSISDFDKVMIEFATSIFILDAGPKQAVEATVETFGLSPTARAALESKVHGPSSSGANMLAIFSTKYGTNTQLITSTIGPIELWAFNTSADDVRIRNALYHSIGAKKARQVLATFFPSGSASKIIESKLASLKDNDGFVAREKALGVIDQIIEEILKKYQLDPQFKE